MNSSFSTLSRMLLSLAALGFTLGADAQVSDRFAERSSVQQPNNSSEQRTPRSTRRAGLSAPSAFDKNSRASTSSIKFSDPTKPGTLKLNLPWAEATITGTDADEVVVTSSLDSKKEAVEVDVDGFRRLDEDVAFELKEKNNVASVSLHGGQLMHMGKGAEFRIEVPRNTNLVIRTQFGGDIAIRNIDGEIDVNSMNGEVVLTNITNAAVINTMNGEVVATYSKVPEKPVSITTMNGEIDLRLPSDAKANLRMRTHNGSIRTNFPDGVLVSKTEKSGISHHEATREVRAAMREATRDIAAAVRENIPDPAAEEAGGETSEEGDLPVAPAAPMPPLPGFGGKNVAGTLNGGGIDISLSSMNGTITLRQAK